MRNHSLFIAGSLTLAAGCGSLVTNSPTGSDGAGGDAGLGGATDSGTTGPTTTATGGTGATSGAGGAGAGVSTGPRELLVTSQTDFSVKVYDDTGAFLRSIGGALQDPLDAVALPDGGLLVADGQAHEIAHFAPDGTKLAPLVTSLVPFGMTLADGTLYVCDQGSGSVRAFDAVTGDDRGSFLTNHGPAGAPTDVQVRDGLLYVGLWNELAVEVFDLESHASEGLLVQQGSPPIALAFAPNGDLFVASLYDGIRRYDAATGALKGSFREGELNTGIAFGPDGALYVATGEFAVRRYSVEGDGGELFVLPGAGGLQNPYHIDFGLPSPL